MLRYDLTRACGINVEKNSLNIVFLVNINGIYQPLNVHEFLARFQTG